MPNSLSTISLVQNGTEISGAVVYSAHVEFGFSTLPKAILVLGVATNTGFIPEFEKERWQPGESLDIKLGFDQESDLVFSGIIVKQKITVSEDEHYKMEIELGHRYYLTSIKKNSRIFSSMKDSEAIQQILNEYRVATEIDATQENQRLFTQFNTSDWDFINSRAEATNRYVIPKNETFLLKNIIASETETLKLTFGSDILAFNLETDSRFSFESFNIKTWNCDDQEIITEESSEPFPSSAGSLSSVEIAKKCHHGSAEIIALGSLSDIATSEIATQNALNTELSKIRGSIRTFGNTSAEIGDWVKVTGVGKQFSGQLLITGIRHEISDGQFTTTYKIGTDPEKHKNQNTASTENSKTEQTSFINGLQIGIVVQLQSPESDDRILVQLPHINSSDGAVWARSARMDAGNNRGWIFRLEIGDEVVVGFLNDDLQQAIILGALNSEVHPAPLEANDQNDLKGYVSRAGLKVFFDEEKKTISISTPNASIELNDDAKNITLKNNGSIIELNSTGITIETQKDLTLRSGGDLNLEGLNIHLKSRANLKAEGTAGVEIQSSAITGIKGSLVQIN